MSTKKMGLTGSFYPYVPILIPRRVPKDEKDKILKGEQACYQNLKAMFITGKISHLTMLGITAYPF